MKKIEIDKIKSQMFSWIGLMITSFGLLVLAILVIDVCKDGLPRLSWDFLTSFPSRKPEKAGIFSAWVGTVWLMFTTAIFAIPIGIGSGIYLEEYARRETQ